MHNPKNLPPAVVNETEQKVSPQEKERRDFLRKLGKYSAVTSVTTVTLMTASKRSAASFTPPSNPGGGFQ